MHISALIASIVPLIQFLMQFVFIKFAYIENKEHMCKGQTIIKNLADGHFSCCGSYFTYAIAETLNLNAVMLHVCINCPVTLL